MMPLPSSTYKMMFGITQFLKMRVKEMKSFCLPHWSLLKKNIVNKCVWQNYWLSSTSPFWVKNLVQGKYLTDTCSGGAWALPWSGL